MALHDSRIREIAEANIGKLSKPGPFGRKHLYVLTYRDKDDEGCPVFESLVYRYDDTHVVDAWNESEDSEGWRLLSYQKVTL